MTDTTLTQDHAEPLGWTVAGQLLDAFTRRDFAAMSECLDSDVRFRALIPPGLVDVTGADATVANFARWFGSHDEFDVIDAAIGQVGTRLYLRWRVQTQAAGDPDSLRVIEQHLFATAADRIHVLDLLCSGFSPLA
jgi:hypothetical protein